MSQGFDARLASFLTVFYTTALPIDASVEPIFHELLVWWDVAREGRSYPLRSQLQLSSIPDVNPWLFIAQVIGDPPDYRYRLSGSLLDHRLGVRITGKMLSELPVEEACLEAIRGQYAQTIAQQRPVLCAHAYKVDGARDVAYQRIAVPASSNSEQADLVIGACAFNRSWATGRGLF